MFTNSQKEFLGDLIVEKMRKGHHTQVKIPKLMDYISKRQMNPVMWIVSILGTILILRTSL